VIPKFVGRLIGNRTYTMAVDWHKRLGSDAITDAVTAAGNRFGIHLRPHDLRRS
jgi:hypothetical protein